MSKWKRGTPGNGELFMADGRVIDIARLADRSKDVSGALVQMTYPHAAVHRDIMVGATHYQDAGSGDLLMFFTTGATLQAHLEYVIKTNATARVRFYRGPIVATAGEAVPTVRMYDPSDRVTQATITVGGTVTDNQYGTLLKDQFNGGGGVGAGVAGGSAVHQDAEWVLRMSTVYCLRVTRATSQIVGIELGWYEVPEIRR